MSAILVVSPASSSKFAPGMLPRVIRTVITVTGWPMSTSSPLPFCRSPNSGVAYQSVSQPVLELPWSTKSAAAGSSPLAPSGPTAVALTAARTLGGAVTLAGGLAADGLAADGLAEGLADGVAAALVVAGALVTVAAGRLAAGVLEWPRRVATSYPATARTIRIAAARAAVSLTVRRSRVLIGPKISVGASSSGRRPAGPCSSIIGETPFAQRDLLPDMAQSIRVTVRKRAGITLVMQAVTVRGGPRPDGCGMGAALLE